MSTFHFNFPFLQPRHVRSRNPVTSRILLYKTVRKIQKYVSEQSTILGGQFYDSPSVHRSPLSQPVPLGWIVVGRRPFFLLFDSRNDVLENIVNKIFYFNFNVNAQNVPFLQLLLQILEITSRVRCEAWSTKCSSKSIYHSPTCFPSRCGVLTVVIKNCDPLVSLPAFAMLRRPDAKSMLDSGTFRSISIYYHADLPGLVCLNLKFSSLNLSP